MIKTVGVTCASFKETFTTYSDWSYAKRYERHVQNAGSVRQLQVSIYYNSGVLEKRNEYRPSPAQCVFSDTYGMSICGLTRLIEIEVVRLRS